MARTPQNNYFGYGALCLAEPSDQQALLTIAEDVQAQAQQRFPHCPEPYVHPPDQTVLAYQQHGTTTVVPSQSLTHEAAYNIEQMHMLPMSIQGFHKRLVYNSPHGSLPTQLAHQQHQQQHQQQRQSFAHKRSLAEFAYEYPEIHQMHALGSNNGIQVPLEITPHEYHDPMRSQAYTSNSDLTSPHSPSGHLGLQVQGHHHHRLSNYLPPSKRCRTGHSDGVYNAEEDDSPSVVGQPGMPQPATKPKGPKQKFTPADDTLLVDLKETKGLMWKQIESFFPGRSSGTLQVRYCTKLKAKSLIWTEDIVSLHSLSGNEQTLLTLFLS